MSRPTHTRKLAVFIPLLVFVLGITALSTYITAKTGLNFWETSVPLTAASLLGIMGLATTAIMD